MLLKNEFIGKKIKAECRILNSGCRIFSKLESQIEVKSLFKIKSHEIINPLSPTF